MTDSSGSHHPVPRRLPHSRSPGELCSMTAADATVTASSSSAGREYVTHHITNSGGASQVTNARGVLRHTQQCTSGTQYGARPVGSAAAAQACRQRTAYTRAGAPSLRPFESSGPARAAPCRATALHASARHPLRLCGRRGARVSQGEPAARLDARDRERTLNFRNRARAARPQDGASFKQWYGYWSQVLTCGCGGSRPSLAPLGRRASWGPFHSVARSARSRVLRWHEQCRRALGGLVAGAAAR